MATRNTFEDWLLLAGRLGLAAVFVASAVDMFRAPEPELKQIEELHLPVPAKSLARAAAVCESLGAAGLILGVFPRTFAALLSGFVGYVSVEVLDFWSDGLPKQLVEQKRRSFVGNLGVIGGLLCVIAAGPGRLAVHAGRSGSDVSRSDRRRDSRRQLRSKEVGQRTTRG